MWLRFFSSFFTWSFLSSFNCASTFPIGALLPYALALLSLLFWGRKKSERKRLQTYYAIKIRPRAPKLDFKATLVFDKVRPSCVDCHGDNGVRAIGFTLFFFFFYYGSLIDWDVFFSPGHWKDSNIPTNAVGERGKGRDEITARVLRVAPGLMLSRGCFSVKSKTHSSSRLCTVFFIQWAEPTTGPLSQFLTMEALRMQLSITRNVPKCINNSFEH